MSSHFSDLSSTLSFVWFSVLPIAFHEILHWLYEWQILVTGILALVAAQMWGRSVVKAARINARARVVDARRPLTEPVVVPTPLAASPDEFVVGRTEPRSAEAADRLHALREQIRIALGKLPCTDEGLTEERLADCRRIAQFVLGEPPAAASKALTHRFDALRSKLAALGAVRDSDTCRNAWEALVRISMDARDLIDSEKTAGDHPG